MASYRDLVDEAERWDGPNRGLALFLNAVRARVGLLVLISAGALVARAGGHLGWPRFVAPALMVTASIVGAAMIVGLARHLRHPRSHAGGWFGALALLGCLAAVALDLYGLAALGGVAPTPPELAALTPMAIALLAELIAFIALAPATLACGALAGTLGARDVRRRSLRAAALVTAATLALGALARLWPVLPERVSIALASAASLLVVLALAKVIGCLRFLLAYVRTMHVDSSSPAPLELRAWHRA